MNAQEFFERHTDYIYEQIGASRNFTGVPQDNTPPTRRRRSPLPPSERAEYYRWYNEHRRKDYCECGNIKHKRSAKCSSCHAADNNRKRWNRV